MSRLGNGKIVVNIKDGQIGVNLEGDLNGKTIQQIPKFLFKSYRDYKKEKLRGVKKEEIENGKPKSKPRTTRTTGGSGR